MVETKEGYKKTLFGKIVENKPIRTGSKNYIITIKITSQIFTQPGHFFLLYPENLSMTKKEAEGRLISYPPSTLLGRPLSLAGILQKDKKTYLTFIYKITGVGTALISEKKPEDPIRLAGPLGKICFSPPNDNLKRLFIVAGGVGAPPLFYLANEYAKKGRSLEKLYIFLGASTANEIPIPQEIKAEQEYIRSLYSFLEDSRTRLLISTDDGTYGVKGLITDLFEEHLKKELSLSSGEDILICSCGPKAMLAKVVKASERFNLPVKVSMEERMACGVGICQGCAIQTSEGRFKLCCNDGPVFSGDEIDWEC